jgi:hypothetical protein
MIPHLLAAGSNRHSLTHAQKWFSRSDPTIIYQILGVIVLLVAILVIAWAAGRFQEWRVEPARRQPMALYMRLMRKLQIPLTDRWRMCQLAITPRCSSRASTSTPRSSSTAHVARWPAWRRSRLSAHACSRRNDTSRLSEHKIAARHAA